MRQVDLDELTYQIFSGLRSWTWSVRKQIFAPLHQRRDVSMRIAADAVCTKLRIWTFIDPVQPRDCVPLEQISDRFAATIGAFPSAISGLWQSGVREREKEAHAAAAMLLAGSVADLEILSGTEIVHFDQQRVRFPSISAPAYAFQPRWP